MNEETNKRFLGEIFEEFYTPHDAHEGGVQRVHRGQRGLPRKGPELERV
jgi:hypothetical protein